jgi:uncharacterized membrane protein
MITILALGLRLVFLNQSLWLDEAIEALALMGKKGPLLQYALGDYQPPLYHLIGWATTHLFGFSEIALRLPSLICGILTVYFVVKIGELLADRRAGFIAGILAATNPLLIYYSQEGRTYAMTAFFVTASFYYFFRLLKNKSDRPATIYYLLSTILFLWTSYLSWFALIFQGIYVLSKKRFDILSLQIFSGLTLLTWLPSFVSSLAIGQSTRTNAPLWGVVVGGLTWKSLPLTWVKFVLGRITFTNKLLYGSVVAAVVFVHLYILAFVRSKKYITLWGWLIFPIILGILTASIIPIYQYFRVLFALPAYLILLALGLAKFKKPLLTYLVVIAQLSFLAIFWFTPGLHREDWRSLTSDLLADGNAAVAIPSRAQDAPLRYYGLTRRIIEPSHEAITGLKIYYIRYAEDLFDTGRYGQANLLSSGYTISSQKYYPGIQVDIYENRN